MIGRKMSLVITVTVLGLRRKQEKTLVDQVLLVFSQYSPSGQMLKLSPEDNWPMT